MTIEEAILILENRTVTGELKPRVGGYSDLYDVCLEALKEKTHSEKRTDKRTETHASDLISRQAAIEKFEPWLKVEGYSEGELNMLKAVLYELRFLSSAQPIAEEDYNELHDRFGAEVEMVVRDMVSGEGKRWMI